MCKNNKNLKQLVSDNSIIKNVFLSGIGGVSMYSLAIFLRMKGHNIIGSDLCESDNVNKLKNLGVKIYNNHCENNIINADLLIYSSATENNIEVKKAKELNIPTYSRAELLSEILKNYEMPICVAGAHGKTTTTALIYSILNFANKKPSLHLGGNLVENNKSYDYKNGEVIVCEACEYKDSFLKFFPKISIILNMSPEHLDYFKNFDNVIESFNKYALNSHICICEENYKYLIKKECITFGIKNANFIAKNVYMLKDGTYSFNCYKNGEFYYHFRINLIGKHNVLNALASICVADILNVDKKDIYFALKTFKGVERRFEYLNKQKFIVHDYAHHPDEIRAIVKEVKKFYRDKLLIVFQPHTYSRTKTLMEDFKITFKNLDEVVLYKTYSAREKYDYKGSACYLAKTIKASYFRSKNKISDFIKEKVRLGYGILFLGAGDIDKLARNINKMC